METEIIDLTLLAPDLNEILFPHASNANASNVLATIVRRCDGI